jgi:hypothetical protein
MDSSYTGDYYINDICKYIAINSNRKYYKSYLLKCLTNKLNKKYNKFELSKELIEILNNNNVYIGWHHHVSPTTLSKYLNSLKVTKVDTNICFVLKINDKGKDIMQLAI